MTTNNKPATDLRHLLTMVADHGRQHLVEIEADLKQTNFLLSGAIEKLGSSFMAIHETVGAQQAALDLILDHKNIDKKEVESVVSYREKLSLEVNAAITGLQFQDMTSQLIMRIMKHVNGLKEAVEALAMHGDATEHQNEHAEISRLLQDLQAHFSKRNDEGKLRIRKSVAQQDMDSGDIELF